MPMTGMETAQRNGIMPEAVRATAMMKTEILQKNRSSVMLSMRTTKPCYGYRRNGSLQWEEDAEGNRTEYYFSTLEDPEDSQYSYDPAGNLTEENYLTTDGTSTKRLHYAYDVYNRNVSVTGDDFTQKNHYDVEDYRDSITEKDKVTNFVYQGGMLLHELDEEKIRQGIMYLAMMKI